MINLEELLYKAVAQEASDIYIIAGLPATFRIHGRIQRLNEEKLMPQQTQALLEAVEDQTGPSWCMLRGELYFRVGQFREAARCFHGAEQAYPRETAQKLEHCYRELEDYKRAYEYACKQKK